jgi:hypothetical protein
MSDARTKEADLAAIASAYELNYTIAANFADDPIVVAAVAHCKATYAACLAAMAEADAARGLRRISTFRHARRAGMAADAASASLRAAVREAERRQSAKPILS